MWRAVEIEHAAHPYQSVRERLMAVTEGYALVRRPGCSPFVLEAKRVRLIPHNAQGL